MYSANSHVILVEGLDPSCNPDTGDSLIVAVWGPWAEGLCKPAYTLHLQKMWDNMNELF